MDHQTVSKSELVLGFAMALFYLGALYSLVSGNRPLLLFFFLIHSCLCILFFLVSCGQISQAALDHCENNHLAEELNEKLSLCQDDLSAAQKTQKELAAENDLLTARLAEMETASAMAPAPSPEKEMPNPLLPSNETRQEFDLAALAGGLLSKLHAKSLECGVRLQLSVSAEPVIINADPELLSILIRNIADNALKYAGRGNSLFITLSNMGDQVFLVFKDNGPGVNEADASHLFDLNYQGANKSSGSGLGLTQVKAIVDHLNGSIEVKSGEGQGLALYIQLPAHSEAICEEEVL